ncbi:pyridoxal phosphate-dependent aminotransferase family protein [Aquimarina sp. RZ0]|uniref:aminotransferase class I/II-fold pyridoxal phosphate-dependent enzyme n=1 Tax=Aquimarina sp. RZ0 TaxID=2607730 RepID=UPI0011F2418E|nr:pyridoxal phosphate-dependent aminotransferase family protein [Aquimarina sp. RZ0]KAA1243615.1 pyridoxal phosphate-dependent aminotransferase family protein [Aquimarina sp. RZ0]
METKEITSTYQGGENIDLNTVLLMNRNSTFRDRIKHFNGMIKESIDEKSNLYRRVILSPAGSEVLVKDIYTHEPQKMLMFGSNNYLDLANHPLVLKKVKDAMSAFGFGIGGPPLLNGTTKLHAELEERLSYLKQAEDTLLFSSGYNANVGLVTALISSKNDCVVYDEYSHASFFDGIKMAKASGTSFKHNNAADLEKILQDNTKLRGKNKFIAVEGVYSMDGDTAPLDKIVSIAKKHHAMTILDDAHGTLILGDQGHGTAEAYGVQKEIDITMGTFSKAFAVTGGFVSGSKELINYLRFFSRSYMFSASIPIPVVAGVLAGIEISENEPWHRQKLMENVTYAKEKLSKYGLVTAPEAAIITLSVPPTMNIRKASYGFHQKGIFINSIEYPAVPLNEQRYRISIMSSHTKSHIDRLVDTVDYVWNNFNDH